MGLLRCYYFRRRKSVNLTVSLVLCCAFFLNVQGSLPLTKPCEDKECQALEYCSPVDHTCKPCKDICDATSNNYDENRCVSDCQDHIHDERYLKLQNSTVYDLQRAELEEKYEALEKDVLILQIAVSVCVVVIIVVVACLLAFFVYFWKLMHPSQPGDPEEKKKAAAHKTTSVELPTVYNNRYGVTTPTPETSPSSVISSSPADTNMTMMTTSTTVPPSYQAMRSSPSKSESSVTTPRTSTTILMPSGASTLVTGRSNNGSVPNANRFRREPSESTLPEAAYDNLSMSPQHNHYSHHV